MDANDYTIRAYTPGDEVEWLRCRVLAYLDSAYFDDVRRIKPRYGDAAIEWVAMLDTGQVVGFIDIECEHAQGTVCSKRSGLGGMIWDIGVHPDYRRRGIAKALLAGAMAHARRQGLVRLEAWTRDDPATIAWYRAQGFAAIESYQHVYFEGSEARANFTANIPGLVPVKVFAHYQAPDDADGFPFQTNRTHRCTLFELRLDA